MRTYFGDAAVDFNATGALAFQAQLYFATLGAALEVAADVSVRRSRNSFGTLTWQLNEIVRSFLAEGALGWAAFCANGCLHGHTRDE